MLKLMLKRFLMAGAIYLLCLFVIYTCAYFYNAFSDSIADLKPVMMVLTYLLCVIISLIFVFMMKLQNKAMYQQYREQLVEAEKSFKSDFLYILKTKEHMASLIVVNCIAIPIELSTGLNAGWNIALVILGALAMFVVHNIVYVALDCLMWMLAFRLRDKKKSKKAPIGEI